MSKVSWKDIFSGFQLTIFKNKRYFIKKLFCIQPFWCTAKLDKVYAIYLVLTKKWLRNDIWQPQQFENLAMIEWLDVGSNLKASII